MPRITLLMCLTLLSAAGCATSSPQRAANSLGEALDQERYEEAYSLMSDQYRNQVPFAEFKAQLESESTDARALASMLQRTEGSGDLTAQITLADGTSVDLVWENGGWKLTRSPFNFYDQSTPRAALRTFIRAMSRRRYDVILRLAPEARAEGLTEAQIEAELADAEVQRLVTVLEESADAPIEVLGERATLVHRTGRVLFVREDGVWKIEDPG